MYKQPQGNQVTITDTEFISDTAGTNVTGGCTGNGGGIYGGDDLHAFNVTFTGNASNWITTTEYLAGGGGIYSSRLLELSGVRFENNSAATSGGGLSSAASVSRLHHHPDRRSVHQRHCCPTGGGIYARGLAGLSERDVQRQHGRVWRRALSPRQHGGQHSLVNSVFAANTAISGTGAAMYLFGSESYAGVITILHTTVASPTLGDGRPSSWARRPPK